jgi:hypothetical protein
VYRPGHAFIGYAVTNRILPARSITSNVSSLPLLV